MSIKIVKQVNSGRKINATLPHIVVHRRTFSKKRMNNMEGQKRKGLPHQGRFPPDSFGCY